MKIITDAKWETEDHTQIQAKLNGQFISGIHPRHRYWQYIQKAINDGMVPGDFVAESKPELPPLDDLLILNHPNSTQQEKDEANIRLTLRKIPGRA